MDFYPKPNHTYTQHGPFTRARVVIYGRSHVEALETARSTRTVFAEALPSDYICWPPVYTGFDGEVKRHTAVFIVAFASSNEDANRRIDALVESL